MFFTTGGHLSSLLIISIGKITLRDVPHRFPQDFDNYDRQFKFDSVFHKENDDVFTRPR